MYDNSKHLPFDRKTYIYINTQLAMCLTDEMKILASSPVIPNEGGVFVSCCLPGAAGT